jgi:hypothetical protein
MQRLGLNHVLRRPFPTRDIDVLLHAAHKLRRPNLMNAMMMNAASAVRMS